MIWLFALLVILLLLFILIIFTKLTIYVNYFHHNDNDELKIEFRIWFGLIRYKKIIPLIKIDDNSPSIVVKSKSELGDSSKNDQEQEPDVKQIEKSDLITQMKNTRELLNRVVQLHEIVQSFLKKVSIKKLEWHTLFGAGDAAHTGMLIGVIWALKGSILGVLSKYFRLKNYPQFTVTPHFQFTVVQSKLSCIFQFRIGHAILAGLKLIKFWKGGLPHFQKKADYSKEKTNSV
jgi:energy-coupling factor transporter transmembrane protein EcfT